jgi:hypothetical protein
MSGKSLDEVWRKMQAQRQAEQERLRLQENLIYEQRERARQDYLQRMRMFESTNTNPAAASAAAGGSKPVVIVNTSGESILYNTFSDGVFSYFIYNWSTDFLSDFKTINMVDSPTIKPVQRGGFFLDTYNSENDNYDLYFISLNGSIIWQDSTDSSEGLDVENFSRYVAVYYPKGGAWKLVAFDENSEIRSFEFQNPIEGGSYSYDDVWNGGFVVREDVEGIYKYYIINFVLGTSTQFKEIDTDIDSMSVYLYAYSDKILTITNDNIFNVFNSTGQEISEFNTLTELGIESYSFSEFSFLGDNGSFLVVGTITETYNVIFFSGVSNQFSLKQVQQSEYGNYNERIYNQKDYTDSHDWIAGGSAAILFYDSTTQTNDITYYNVAKILPIWSTDETLRDFIDFNGKGIADNGFGFTRSESSINLLIDNNEEEDTEFSVLRLNRLGSSASLITTPIDKSLEIYDRDRMNGRTVFQFQKTINNEGTSGWSDLSNIEERFYYSLKSSSDGNFPDLVSLNIETVLKDLVNDKYWAIQFTNWQGGGGGAFSYTRQLIQGGTFSGDIITFIYSSYGYEVDIIEEGILELTRGEYGPIYNRVFEEESNGINPVGTLWNSEYVYGELNEYDFYMFNLQGQIVGSVSTSNSIDDEEEGATYVLEDKVFSKLWISNNQEGGNFQLLPDFYTIEEDNNDTTEETGLLLGNFIISSGFRSRIVTENSISNEFIIPSEVEFSKIDDRDVSHNGAWVVTNDINNWNFYFYNLSGELVAQKNIEPIDFSYNHRDYGIRSTIYYKNDGKYTVLLFTGTELKEVTTEFSSLDTDINDYTWWDAP